MRPTRATVLLTAGLVTLLGIPAVAAADTPTDLYVNSREGSHCSDAATGTPTAPFCSVSAAAKVVEPGQTVRIASDNRYPEAVTIDRSGEPGKPITFVSDSEAVNPTAHVDKGLTISGASHVVIRRLDLRGGVTVSRSTDVVIEKSDITKGMLNGLVVGDASTDVRVSQSRVSSPRIEGGSRRTVLSRNEITGPKATAAAVVVDAPGTALTNNSISGSCETTVSVGGGSTGSSVVNNVFFTVTPNTSCPQDKPRNSVAVAQSATEGTRADYNVFANSPLATQLPYTWSGTSYKDLAAFQAATGQGGHDIVAPDDRVSTVDDSLTIDSGDPTAPGALLTADIDGNPVADDPRVPNTGGNGGFVDRGAYETGDGLSSVWMSVDNEWAPLGTKVVVQSVSNSRWPTAMSFSVDFGDGTTPLVIRQGTASQATATHVYGSPCSCVVKVTAFNGVGAKVVTSKRITVGPAALTADFTTEPVIPVPGDEEGAVRPLTVEFDPRATKGPWPVASVDVEFGDGGRGLLGLSPFRHTYREPGNYQVTVTAYDIHGAQSTVVKTVRVGYTPSGYVATDPFRLLDSRTTNTTLRGGFAFNVTLPVGEAVPEHPLSGSMAAAVLNVTVTGATEDTHLSVWPSGPTGPNTSTVNVNAGGTASNTVTVPVGADGQISVLLNSGRASLIVDFIGYYQPNIGQRFSPLTPTRVADTRTAGGALGGGKTRTVKVAGVNGIPADATAVALNLTGTGATEQAHVIAYPDPAKRPSTSNLNVEPGKDKSNQAIVPVGPNGTITLFANSGSTHLVLDAVGYYGKDGKALFTPVVPKRLADTRTTGKVAPGATTTVGGLPAGALGAVLNVTATDSTGPGFLTAYGYGGTLPGASSLNTLPGRTVPNHVISPVASGKVSIFNSYGGGNHVITDLLGYFTQG
ncbi:PKD domain-containing protein [Streptomyces sp. ISL-43]|uniref:PKD domain-containing protein n=1 Tax=Streptomyces sp. ISL-43 TaxID=2819183 RepID=UPI001BEA11BE|nr:PKD domain-containing protein [Streptomyces sp. ISL-43]MBT2446240.1 PKD domain-containing protein [Streptomyces sp. ISL-43]